MIDKLIDFKIIENAIKKLEKKEQLNIIDLIEIQKMQLLYIIIKMPNNKIKI